MKTYCLKCRKYVENIDPEMVRTKNNRLIMQSNCHACRIKGLLSNLGIKTPLFKITLVNVLF